MNPQDYNTGRDPGLTGLRVVQVKYFFLPIRISSFNHILIFSLLIWLSCIMQRSGHFFRLLQLSFWKKKCFLLQFGTAVGPKYYNTHDPWLLLLWWRGQPEAQIGYYSYNTANLKLLPVACHRTWSSVIGCFLLKCTLGVGVNFSPGLHLQSSQIFSNTAMSQLWECDVHLSRRSAPNVSHLSLATGKKNWDFSPKIPPPTL